MAPVGHLAGSRRPGGGHVAAHQRSALAGLLLPSTRLRMLEGPPAQGASVGPPKAAMEWQLVCRVLICLDVSWHVVAAPAGSAGTRDSIGGGCTLCCGAPARSSRRAGGKTALDGALPLIFPVADTIALIAAIVAGQEKSSGTTLPLCRTAKWRYAGTGPSPSATKEPLAAGGCGA